MSMLPKKLLIRKAIDLLFLFLFYFVMKAAVRNGVREALHLKGIKRRERLQKLQRIIHSGELAEVQK